MGKKNYMNNSFGDRNRLLKKLNYNNLRHKYFCIYFYKFSHTTEVQNKTKKI